MTELERTEKDLKYVVYHYCNEIGCNRCSYRADDGNCTACQLDRKIDRLKYEQIMKEENLDK